MGLHKATAIRHLSYQQLEEMLRSLGEQILTSGRNNPTIQAVDTENQCLTWLMSEITGIPVGHGRTTLKLGLTSELDTDICIFKKNFNSEHYNRTVKHYVEDLYQEEDESFTKITLPWRK